MPKLPERSCQRAGTWRPVEALIQTFAHLSARMDRSWSMRRMGYWKLIDKEIVKGIEVNPKVWTVKQ